MNLRHVYLSNIQEADTNFVSEIVSPRVDNSRQLIFFCCVASMRIDVGAAEMPKSRFMGKEEVAQTTFHVSRGDIQVAPSS
jgi:hypothetical protein